VFAKAIIRVLLQRPAPEIRELYEPRRVVVGAEPLSLRTSEVCWSYPRVVI
jgi:hypothetical protein